MKMRMPEDPSLGNIEADVFDPAEMEDRVSEAGVRQMDAADAFWAASIVSRFTDEMIRAIVDEARLSDPEASSYLARRDHQAARQGGAMGHDRDEPLDRFDVRHGVIPELVFENAAGRLHVMQGTPEVSGHVAAVRQHLETYGAPRAAVNTTESRLPVQPDVWGAPDAAGIRYAVASIWSEDSRTIHTGWHP